MINRVSRIVKVGSVAVALGACVVVASHASDVEKLGSEKKAALMTQITKTFPKMRVDSLEESPIKGLYEVIAGDQVFYYGDSGHLFFGEIWSKEGKSLTAEKRKGLMEAKLKKLPLDLAVKTGNGPKTVIEFTDPDCPFCRKMDDFLAKRTDITRYTFFFPLRQLHPDAPKKAQYVISAKDQQKAFSDVFSGRINAANITPESLTPESQKRLARMEQLGRELGVKGTPALWIEGVFINGADLATASKILDGGKEVAK